MSSSKTINISPKLFKVNASKPSRKREKHQSNKLNKHKLINRLKQHMSTQKNQVPADQPADQNLSNFDKHLSYFQKLNKEKKKTRSRNKSENVFTALPTDMKSGLGTGSLKEAATHYRIKPAPNYGILKGTNKPTMREWKRSTQKNTHHVLASAPSLPEPLPSESPRAQAHASIPPPTKYSILPPAQSQPEQVRVTIPSISNNLSTPTKPLALTPVHSISSVTPTAKPNTSIPSHPNRKTFHLGKRENKIGVLIKNNSTRKRIKDEINILNAASIIEVKQYLKECQLYKAGNNTPQDVLREIYKSAHLAGKPVKNKSKENLLHNFYK
jgi:hypothetical protein